MQFLGDSGSWFDENNQYFLVTLVSHESGLSRIQDYFDQIRIISVMNPVPNANKLFHEQNNLFTKPEKGILKKYCHTIEPSKLFRYGYKNTQSNIIFYERASNNILPILYSNNKGWIPLFPR